MNTQSTNTAEKLAFFTKRGDKYYMKDNSYLILFVSLFVLVIVPIDLYKLVQKGGYTTPHIVNKLAPLLVLIPTLSIGTRKTWISPQQSEIVRSYLFGLIKHVYPFSSILKFEIVRTTINFFIYTGNEVQIQTTKKYFLQTEMTFRSFYNNTKKVNDFIIEAQQIMNKNNTN